MKVANYSPLMGRWLEEFRTLHWKEIGLEISLYEKI